MRIAAWNIRAGGGRRVEEIGAELERWRADVVALSEFRATPPSRVLAARLAELGLAHQRATTDPARPGTNGLLVAARWPLRRLRVRAEPAEPHRWLLLSVGAPHPFALGSMHVPNRASGRKDDFHAATLAVARRWRGGAALLLGDTNSGRRGLDEEVPVFGPKEDGWMRDLESVGWTDAFRHLRGEAREYTWWSPNGRNGFRLDQAFVNRRLLPRLRAVRHVWGGAPELLSDHKALLIDFELDG